MIIKLMTKSEYSKHRGVSKSYISKCIKRGKITLEQGDKIDPEKADKALGPSKNGNIHILPVVSKKTEPKPDKPGKEITVAEGLEISAAKILSSENVSEAQQYKEVYAALTKKTEYEKMIGSLLPAEEIEKSMFDIGRHFRDTLLALPERISPAISADTGIQHQVRQNLKKEITQILNDLADFFEGIADEA